MQQESSGKDVAELPLREDGWELSSFGRGAHQAVFAMQRRTVLMGGRLFWGRRLDSSVVITGHGYFSLTTHSYII